MWEKIKNDPLIKTVVVILLGVLAFGLAFHIMFGSGSSSMDDGSMMSSGTSSLMIYPSFNFTSLLVFLLKVLICVFIIVIGYVVVIYFKENYNNIFSAKDNDSISAATKDCPDCNAKVKDAWKCCPYCGSDKVSNIKE